MATLSSDSVLNQNINIAANRDTPCYTCALLLADFPCFDPSKHGYLTLIIQDYNCKDAEPKPSKWKL